jgi:hypothetical protein
MKIGYVVEGDNDAAFLDGLKERWCPDAELLALAFRGSDLRHRDYPRIIQEARLKDIDVIIFLTDSNTRPWKTVLAEERTQLTKAGGDDVLLGVAERNIECWLCADPDYTAKKLECDREQLTVEDPKNAFCRAMGIQRDDKKRTEIAKLISDAPPLKNWLNKSPSLMHFYTEVRSLSSRMGCYIPDELEGSDQQRRRRR